MRLLYVLAARESDCRTCEDRTVCVCVCVRGKRIVAGASSGWSIAVRFFLESITRL